MKISTKTGDKGETTLLNGKSVSKASKTVNLLGDLDELQSFLGFCRFVISHKDGKEACRQIDMIQDDISRIMTAVSFEMKSFKNIEGVSEKNIIYLEKNIEMLEKKCGVLKGFVKPGSGEASSRFHLARSVCRRAERSAADYDGEKNINYLLILKYLNRLSDLLFLLACKFEAEK